MRRTWVEISPCSCVHLRAPFPASCLTQSLKYIMPSNGQNSLLASEESSSLSKCHRAIRSEVELLPFLCMPRPGDIAYHRHPHPRPPPPSHHPRMQLTSADGYGAHEDGRNVSLEDIVLLVGKRRQPYHVNAQSLMRGSEYFRRLLERGSPGSIWPSLALDCDESIFENLLLLMRYGAFEALPPMSAAEMYQLKKEADFYGIHYAEPQSAHPAKEMSSDSSSMSDLSDPASPVSPLSDSPKSTINRSPPQQRRAPGRRHEGVSVACSTPQHGLSELPDFPLELADPGKMVLMTCLDMEKARVYNCACGGGDRGTQWALNFHHRHAFCTACGEAPQMPAKHFAEMFMAAASIFLSEQRREVSSEKWQLGCDSTCLLRFVRSATDGTDGCGCAAAVGRRAAAPTVWAASSYYSHAFCTSCGQGAQGPVLVSVLLALRYGGSGSRGSRSARFSTSARH